MNWGEHLIKNNSSLFSTYNIIKGFLNLTVTNTYWINFLEENYNNDSFGKKRIEWRKM
ncbi:MAG: hypothetical protein WDM71_05515 [Ferruginibacter sp.]